MRGCLPFDPICSTMIAPACRDDHAEVLIAGGGPAGTTLARRLVRLGYDVMLVTESEGRRRHLLETVAPVAFEQMVFLGLLPALTDALLGTPDCETRWGDATFLPRRPTQLGHLIDRSRFDAALLELAVAEGVPLRVGRVLHADRAGGGWRLIVAFRSGLAAVTSRLLIDATGRRGLPPRRLRRGYRLLGLHGCWRGKRLPDVMRLASGANYWVWGAPAGNDRYATTLFLDPLKRVGDDGALAARFETLVRASGVLEGAADATPAGPVSATDATPYVDRGIVGEGYFRIGDAALAIDPLSSAGIQAALQSATAAAVAIHTLLHDPGTAGLCEAFLERGLDRRHARHAAWTATFYAEAAARFPDPFWAMRAAVGAAIPAPSPTRAPLPAPDQPLSLDRDVQFRLEPCVVGDKVAWHRAVIHPALTEPAAFRDGIDLTALLERIRPGITAQSVIRDWAACSALGPAMSTLSWAWRRGVIGPAEDSAAEAMQATAVTRGPLQIPSRGG
jgi:flavin-dependent dehydrogenase